jgi:hypothetical protein
MSFFIYLINLPWKCDNYVLVKTIIMHKYVSVYILLLMYNSSSMCYIENIVENLKMFLKKFYCNEIYLHVY